MLNRTQVGFIVSMEILGIPITMENATEVYKVSYLAQQRGLQIAPKIVYYDKRNGKLSSETRRTHYDDFDENLLYDIKEVSCSRPEEIGWAKTFQMKKSSAKKLEKLKIDIEKKGIEKLLKAKT